MPVHVEELVIASLQGWINLVSILDISRLITSRHYRTVVSNVTTSASDSRILSVTGTKLRSLASHHADLEGHVSSRAGNRIIGPGARREL